jgi:hypothetical protein
MTRVHHIRLGPPWQVTALPDGRVRHARRFGRPRTLDANERLLLARDGLPGGATVRVNGVELSAPYDITVLLQPRNEVVIETAAGEVVGEVTVEVWVMGR